MSEPPTANSTPATPGRNLPMAIAIGVVMAGGFLLSAWYGATPVTVFIGLFMLLGVVESSAQFRRLGRPPVVMVLVVTVVVMATATRVVGHLGQVLGLLVLMLGAGLWLLIDPDRQDVVSRVAVTLLVGAWLPFLGSFAIMIAEMESGRFALVLVIASAALADIGAFAVGSLVGRHKIAPSLSPNKSWEGFVGGLVVAGLTGLGLATWLFGQFSDGRAVAISIAVAVAAFGGDLFESMVKRDLGIKDFGSLLPGHGGVLDRVDGILVALPVGFMMLAVT